MPGKIKRWPPGGAQRKARITISPSAILLGKYP
jgi:hypothetical protein